MKTHSRQLEAGSGHGSPRDGRMDVTTGTPMDEQQYGVARALALLAPTCEISSTIVPVTRSLAHG
jgi:hypothetical protein